MRSLDYLFSGAEQNVLISALELFISSDEEDETEKEIAQKLLNELINPSRTET